MYMYVYIYVYICVYVYRSLRFIYVWLFVNVVGSLCDHTDLIAEIPFVMFGENVRLAHSYHHRLS